MIQILAFIGAYIFGLSMFAILDKQWGDKMFGSTFRQLSKWWRTLFPRTIRQFEQTYCSICDGRIWFWQSATRLYSLGMTRAHVDCAASYLRSKIEEDHKVRLRAVGALLGEVRQGLINDLKGDKKHEKHYQN